MTASIAWRDVRPSPIAGRWYPGNAVELAGRVDTLMAQVPPSTLPGPVVGLVAPHAGYDFSAATAAHAYAQVKGKRFGTVVILGPDHHGERQPFGVPAYRSFSTPLGRVDVDTALVAELGNHVPLEAVVHDMEHSLEIQLPFLQRALGAFSILPIMLRYPLGPYYGQEAWQACLDLSRALTTVLSGRDDVLIVASTDLSHLDDYREVERHDKIFLETIQKCDAKLMAEALRSEACHACGGAAVVTMLLTARERGACAAIVLAYTHSGNVMRRRVVGEYTVGYAAVAITVTAAS